MHRSRIIFGILSVASDFAAVALALLLARTIRSHGDFIPFVQLSTGFIPTVREFLPFVAGAATLLVLILAVNGSYDLRARPTFTRFFVRLFFMSTAWLMILFSYFFLTKNAFFSRIVLIYGWILAMVFATAGRLLLSELERFTLRRGWGKQRVGLVGETSDVKRIERLLQMNPRYQIMDKHASDIAPEKLETWCEEHNIHEIIQVGSSGEWPVARLATFCARRHVHFRFVPDLWQIDEMNFTTMEESGVPMMELQPTKLEGWGRVLKRAFDTVASIAALILLSPVMLLIAVVIKLDARGPVFFRQQRIGYHGEPFTCVKFRSMVAEAETLKQKLAALNERAGPLFKIHNDPRVTRVGKFLRKTSLDELPQLFNVFLGHMSLVGPRPHLSDEVERYEERQRSLLSVKPGITGMAQVNGRSGLSFTEEARLDLYYIRNWSFWLDIGILMATLLVAVKGENAE